MKVLVFGVFDKFHEGHKNFLRQARVHGDALVVVVAPDHIAHELKDKHPQWDEMRRVEHVQAFDPEAEVVLGDDEQGTYEVIHIYEPDLICLGYDQSALKSDLEKKMSQGVIPTIAIIELQPHAPELYKSSLITPHFEPGAEA
ncbi:MAG: hypothetical protein A3A33_04030 [Candidatus Yanofskybacteria bacterium RIFCSPLOWO2_01_FULL_49_25]|uniref:Cytidyltransferase-like domain-containing protein n=1 Tax=Candidatus Yanofskybacteria bacterium RIFCSPLOWO2_01_FULL_49_25 TaxID=1802701 RepID=A0A1F8GTX8_9BACT|nr:MAG: hypothetical protein A3A33_04030 [Candidatus Yanofskybacteria bacterium RIFCSPLOWO2_01_FULL_49_25]